MKKFEGMLICTDLDGTLLRRDGSISLENLDAIEYFKSEGGLFTFITGRMPFFVSRMLEAVAPNAPIGCINGGGLFDHRAGKYVWTQELSPACLSLVAAVEKEMPDVGFQVNLFDRIYFCHENPTMERFRHATGVPNLTCCIDEIREPIAKIVFGHNDAERIATLEKFLRSLPGAENFGFVRSEHTLFEILPLGIHKGTVLERLVEFLHLDPKRTVALGDYNNDIGMLKTAGVGVAVANASPEAKAAADLVTVSNEEHAIAKVIEDLGAGRLLA